MRCERGDCPDQATHLVYIWFPDAPEEIWRVCRAHDRGLKLAFPSSRPRPEPIEEPPSSPRVHCRQCDQPSDEAVGDVRDEGLHPCPYCGSLKRHVRVSAADFAFSHESARVRSKQPEKGGWLKDVSSGDSYTRDLDAWGHRTLEKDYDNNQYRELIELYDGSRLESTAMLDNHHDLPRAPSRFCISSVDGDLDRKRTVRWCSPAQSYPFRSSRQSCLGAYSASSALDTRCAGPWQSRSSPG
jgi:hypothetical protein